MVQAKAEYTKKKSAEAEATRAPRSARHGTLRAPVAAMAALFNLGNDFHGGNERRSDRDLPDLDRLHPGTCRLYAGHFESGL